MGVSPLSYRVLEPLISGRDRNILLRQQANTATMESWRERPLLGQGVGSVNRLAHSRRPERVPENKRWNGNMALFVLHDSGVVGLVTLVGLVGAAATVTWRALSRVTDVAEREILVPLAAVGVALLFAYQFMHGLWLMYPYVYLGRLAAATLGERAGAAPALPCAAAGRSRPGRAVASQATAGPLGDGRRLGVAGAQEVQADDEAERHGAQHAELHHRPLVAS